MLGYGKMILIYIVFACMPVNENVAVVTKYFEGNKNAAATTEDSVITESTEEDGSQDTDINQDMAYDEIYNLLDIDGLERKLEDSGLNTHISVRGIINGIINGDREYVSSTVIKAFKGAIAGELLANRTLMLQLVAIVLLGSIFVNLSGSFGNGFISENGFYITYLIITSIMLTSFSISLELVESSIEKILVLIRIIVPVYALAMNYVGHAMSAVGMYEIILVGIWLVQVVILKLILPMIKFYVIISLINNLNREDSFSKMCQLIKNLVGWMLKTIVVFVAGLNIIKSLIEPQIDALGRNTVNRVISSIPGGGIMSVLAGTFLGAGLVVKNSIGVAGIILLALVVMIPVIKTFLIMLTVKITAVLIQPVGEKRYVDGVEALSQGMSMLLQTVGSSVVLFMLTIAIMAFSSGGG